MNGEHGRLSPVRLAIWIAIAALLSSLAFSTYFSTGSTNSKNTLFQWSTAASAGFFYALMIAVSIFISNDRPELRALRRSQISIPAALGLGLLSIVATLIAFGIVSIFVRNPGRQQGLLTEHWQSNHVAAFAVNAAAVMILAPIAEELFVRGLGFGLFRPIGRSVSLLLPALAWALMHGIPAGIIPLTIFGIGLGYLRERSDSVIPGMVVHGFYNGLALMLAYHHAIGHLLGH